MYNTICSSKGKISMQSENGSLSETSFSAELCQLKKKTTELRRDIKNDSQRKLRDHQELDTMNLEPIQLRTFCDSVIYLHSSNSCSDHKPAGITHTGSLSGCSSWNYCSRLRVWKTLGTKDSSANIIWKLVARLDPIHWGSLCHSLCLPRVFMERRPPWKILEMFCWLEKQAGVRAAGELSAIPFHKM